MGVTSNIISSVIKGQKILSLLTFLRITSFFWPQPAVVEDGASFDFVIVGGGTAGCVIASELAKLDVSVLLIEAGDQPTLATDLPALFPLLKNSELDWNFTSVYNEETNKYNQNGVIQMQQGKVLGGSGQVNYMIYGKGVPNDYNKWAEITKDSSWEFKNLCRLFKKIEKVTDKKILNSPDVKFHGTAGKIKIKKYCSALNEKYFESYRELGIKTLPDLNPNNTLGYTNAYFNIHSRGRQSTAFSYLSPEKDNPNLSVLYNALATEIVFKNKKAVGVKINLQNGKTITVKVNREVIVTAGVMKSPQLLLLSGIGPKSHLEEKHIKPISDLPVGENFQDHPTVIMIYKMKEAELRPRPNPYEFPVAAMQGNVALNESQGYPDYQILSGVINFSEFFTEACAFIFTFNYDICDYMSKSLEGRQVHFVTHSLLYPESRGKVLLNNKDPKQKPIIMPGYYSKETDLDKHAKYLDHYNQVLKTKYFKSVEAELVLPNLKTCEGLDKRSMEYWKCYTKAMSTTLHMYFGTCAMGSVVDSELRVMGVENLRVADASVIPSSIGGIIQSTVIVIAERLVELLKKDYNLSM